VKTLLVAVREEDRQEAAAIAGHEFRVYLASTIKEAISITASADLDGIICGAHLNEGTMFDFVQLVRSHPKTAALPVVVVRAKAGRLNQESYKAIELACAEKGVPYIDAVELVELLGEDAGYAELRRRIHGFVP
jgi:CheY-like chemotaxis protein